MSDKEEKVLPTVDLNQLTAQITAVLAPAAPYLAHAAEGAASKIGADAWEQAKKLYAQVRDWFGKEKNDKANQTLDLFLGDPETFESALAKFLLGALQTHPEWAKEVRETLAAPSLQEIILKNNSRVERITQSLSGSGVQRYKSDDSTGVDVKQIKH